MNNVAIEETCAVLKEELCQNADCINNRSIEEHDERSGSSLSYEDDNSDRSEDTKDITEMILEKEYEGNSAEKEEDDTLNYRQEEEEI